MKTLHVIISERHLSAINMCLLLRVMEFSASTTRACALQTIRTYARTNERIRTPPALCLGTPVPRQKPTL